MVDVGEAVIGGKLAMGVSRMVFGSWKFSFIRRSVRCNVDDPNLVSCHVRFLLVPKMNRVLGVVAEGHVFLYRATKHLR